MRKGTKETRIVQDKTSQTQNPAGQIIIYLDEQSERTSHEWSGVNCPDVAPHNSDNKILRWAKLEDKRSSKSQTGLHSKLMLAK